MWCALRVDTAALSQCGGAAVYQPSACMYRVCAAPAAPAASLCPIAHRSPSPADLDLEAAAVTMASSDFWLGPGRTETLRVAAVVLHLVAPGWHQTPPCSNSLYGVVECVWMCWGMNLHCSRMLMMALHFRLAFLC